MLRTKTGCKAKPVGNPPVYPPHNQLIIVNWYACVQRSTYILSYPIAREPNPADCKAEIGLLAWSTKLVDGRPRVRSYVVVRWRRPSEERVG